MNLLSRTVGKEFSSIPATRLVPAKTQLCYCEFDKCRLEVSVRLSGMALSRANMGVAFRVAALNKL